MDYKYELFITQYNLTVYRKLKHLSYNFLNGNKLFKDFVLKKNSIKIY